MDGFLTFLKLTGSLILVIVLAYGTLRYLLPFLQRGSLNTQRNMEIIERLAVAPRVSLCLVKAGKRYFLVGITPTRVSYLQEIKAEELVLPANRIASDRFADILQAQKLKFPFSRRQGDDDA